MHSGINTDKMSQESMMNAFTVFWLLLGGYNSLNIWISTVSKLYNFSSNCLVSIWTIGDCLCLSFINLSSFRLIEDVAEDFIGILLFSLGLFDIKTKR